MKVLLKMIHCMTFEPHNSFYSKTISVQGGARTDQSLPEERWDEFLTGVLAAATGVRLRADKRESSET